MMRVDYLINKILEDLTLATITINTNLKTASRQKNNNMLK